MMTDNDPRYETSYIEETSFTPDYRTGLKKQMTVYMTSNRYLDPGNVDLVNTKNLMSSRGA